MSHNITPSNKPKINSLSRLKRYLDRYKAMILGVLVSLIITSGSVLMVGEGIKLFIDDGVSARDAVVLDEALGFLLVIVIILSTFTFSRFFLVTYIGERVVADIRKDIFKKILQLSPSFYERKRTGDVISRMTADTTVLLTTIGSSMSVALRNIVMFTGGIVVLFNHSPKLTLLILGTIPFVVMPIVLMGRKMKQFSRNSQDRVADISAHSEEAISMIKTVQAYIMEDFEIRKFNYKIKAQLKAALQRTLLRGLMSAMVISLAFSGIAVVLWYGGHLVLNGALTPGELSAFVYIAIVCSGAIGALSDVAGDLQRAAGAVERVFEFLDCDSEIKDKAGALELKNVNGKISFRNVQFSYSPDRPVIKNFSLDINPGTVTALIGKSGAGKTTIFSLLERFYDVREGKILLDDVDIKDLKVRFLRSCFTYVPQEPVLFSETIYDNIAYGNPKATEQMVIEAANLAQCNDFIDNLPNGIYTHVGSKGAKLSTGQKQRIIIARSMLMNPKVLLLDEATSALDSENEMLVHKALQNLMQGRTTIVIAHRLNTVENADQIVVMDGGEIIEHGVHRDLINKKNGLYKKLLEYQIRNHKK